MEPPKYYGFYNGFYDVHFANTQGLSIDEITNIFNEFGKVVGVSATGDAHGYRFVKYRHEEEVLRCVEGLRNHQTIRLRLKDLNFKKNKNLMKNNKVPSVSNCRKNYENYGQTTEFHDKKNRRSFESTAVEKSAMNTENKIQYLNNNVPTVNFEYGSAGEQKKNNTQGVSKMTENLETKVEKSQETQTTYFESSKPTTPLRQPEVAAKTFMPVSGKTPATDNVSSSMKPLNILLGVENSFKSNVPANTPVAVAKYSNTVTSIQPDVAVPLFQLDAAAKKIPRLVIKPTTFDTSKHNKGVNNPQTVAAAMPVTVTAEEVIVANIHTDFGIHYILHLIQKHNPLSVSAMKIIPSLELRYCIVYLQSLHQAQEIQKEFDKCNLGGKELIVLRSQILLEQTEAVY